MTPTSPLFAVSVYLVAYLSGFLLYRQYKIDMGSGRYETIDGLRGFLALGVFIHHSYIWYFLLHGQGWTSPESHIYNQLGQSSVALFFMITSFLFVSKLLNTKDKPFDWKRFFISRWYRLAPMYYVSIAAISVVVMILTGWQLRVPVSELLTGLFHLAAFTVTDGPTLNGCDETLRINAGVLWSLPFEWLFYFSLPLIGLVLLKKKPSWPFLVISLLFFLWYTWAHGFKIHHMISFGGGAVAPFLMRFSILTELAKKWFCSLLILGCLVVMSLYPSADKIPCKLALITMFNLVALGNSFFGLLCNNVIKFLGEMAYSTYLMHGIILFVTIRLILGMENVAQFSPLAYIGLILLLTPVVVLISFLGFKFVEKPFMDKSKKINTQPQSGK